MTSGMRRTVVATAVAVLTVVLVPACTAWGTETHPDSTPSSTPTEADGEQTPCLSTVVYPERPVWELNATLPVAGVSPEYVQAEVGVIRGSADCGQVMQATATSRNCPIAEAPSSQTFEAMLGTTPDAVTAAEFDRGSVAAISELVTGRTMDGGGYQYRLSAWQYEEASAARASQIPDLVRSCIGSKTEQFGSIRALTVFEGDEPYLVGFVDGATAYLIESIRNVAPDGSITKIADTPTGLLPSEAVATQITWWLHYGSEPLATPAETAGESA